MTRYSFLVQYLGKNYAGSQIQFTENKEQPTETIQGVIERAICTLIGVKSTPNNIRPIKTVFSGRTDAGVSSLGQVVHFDIDKDIVASFFIKSINGILPKDISVSDFQKVSDSFHSQKSAKRRHYRYTFINRNQRKAFDGDILRVGYEINLERMQNSLNYLLGSHDFSSFRNTGSSNPYTDCIIYEAKCMKKDDDVITIDIVGNRFLYNMIRIIVGTLLEIERNNLSSEHMKEVLEAKNRQKAGATVNPYGLTFMKVEY